MKITKNLVALAFLLLFSTACFAQTPTETLNVAGLKESVIVRRDARGISYIDAKSDADLYFTQGFVTASDRLWQMDLYRRVARGQTAELFGKLTLEEDKRWRRFGFSNVVAETYKNFPAESRRIVDDYARGVNAYIATLDEKTLPPEFQILRYRPSEWLATDSLVVGAIINDGLSTTWQTDLLRASFADLPREKYDKLFMERTPDDVLVVGRDAEIQSSKFKIQSRRGESRITNDELQKNEIQNLKSKIKNPIDASLLAFAAEDARIRKSSLERIGFYQEGNAMSNNWVVSGKRTADGKPLLANDPHLPATAPSVWYLTHLSTGDSRVSGVTFSGVPGVVLGHNENIAWGATNLGPDVQDLYAETFNDKNQYKTQNGWQDARVRREEIKVRKNLLSPETTNETLDVFETRNGVVISEQAGKKYALKWTALDAKNDSFTAFLRLNRARNWDDFRAALATYGGATQNFVYADVKGNIGYYGAGRIPVRRTGDGAVPYDGASDAGDWTSFIPFEDLPNSYNPPENLIVTANQRVAGDSYKYFLTHSWASPYRAKRIYELLRANPKLTVNDFKNIQNDIYSIPYSNFARETVKLGAASKESLNVLQSWDGKMAADSKGALLTNEIGRVFVRKILIANIGEPRAERLGWGNLTSFVDWVIREKPAAWLPKEFKDYRELMIASDKEARENLTKRYGADESKWVWGAAARANFAHPLAAAPLVGGLFAVESFGQNGNGTTPNVGASVSMRHVTAPGNWDATLHGIALGESGDPKSPHYKDQLESWKSGDTQSFPFTKPAVEAAAKRVILMKP